MRGKISLPHRLPVPRRHLPVPQARLARDLGLPLSKREIDEAMREMDEDGSGEIDFDEFAGWWSQSRKTSAKMAEAVSRYSSQRAAGAAQYDRPFGRPSGVENTAEDAAENARSGRRLPCQLLAIVIRRFAAAGWRSSAAADGGAVPCAGGRTCRTESSARRPSRPGHSSSWSVVSVVDSSCLLPPADCASVRVLDTAQDKEAFDRQPHGGGTLFGQSGVTVKVGQQRGAGQRMDHYDPEWQNTPNDEADANGYYPYRPDRAQPR